MMDIGFDLVTAYGNLLKRAQIKATQMDENIKTSSTSFSVKRNKAGHVRNGTYMPAPARGYEIDEVDVFIFANIKHGHFYVIPAEEIDLKRYKLSLSPDSKWANAWWVLKTP
jgi:acyl-CoA thioesterase